MGIVAIVVTGSFVCGENLSAESGNEVPVPAEDQPAVKEAKASADEKPIADEKPADAEKPASQKEAMEYDLGALINPLQELFGLGGGEAVQLMPGVEQAADANADPENNPQFQQFRQMHYPKLVAELRFIRLVCSDLPADKRVKIWNAAEASLKKVALRMAKQQNQMQVGIVMNSRQAEPGKEIRDAIFGVLKETLNEEQTARFKEESDKRDASRKRTIILSVVSLLDGKLFLETEQREKIEQTISSRWQDSWEKWSLMTIYGGQYLPQIPDECVVPHLNAEQKKVWNGIQKVDFGWWWGGENQVPNQDDDQWWGVETKNGPGNRVQVNGAILIEN
jgi:hypothetical protein